MRILAVVSEPPWPAVSGYRIRCWELLSRLAARHEVRLVTRHAEAAPDAAASWTSRFASVRFVPAARTGAGSLARSLVQEIPHHAALHDGAELRRALAEESRGCDVAYVHYLYFARAWFSAGDALPPAVLDQHNVDHETWESHASAAVNPLLRAWLRRQARLVRADEARWLGKFAAILSVSEADAEETRRLVADPAAVHVAQNGADCERFRPVPRERAGSTVLFAGTNARRNLDGLAWFLREAWPRVRAEVPAARLLVAGSLDPARLPRDVRGEASVTFTGPRESLQFAFDEADVAVVPVRLGGGTKLKTFEALASGLPVVALSAPARGLCCDETTGLLARSGAPAYAAALVQVLRDTELRRRLGEAARRHAEQAHDWGRIALDVERRLEEVGGRRGSVTVQGDRAGHSGLTLDRPVR